jgi:RNA polymerase sigma factor (TIGR02999 family)
LIEFGRGDSSALERLIPLVYAELHRLAQSHRYNWRGSPGVPGTTSLVHEAYLRLVDQEHVTWRSRSQFYCIASRAMRSVLIDNARAYNARKRHGEGQPVSTEDILLVSKQRGQELIEVDEALSRLGEIDQELSAVVECRFFGGLTIEETAEGLSLSPATVKRRWNLAQAWLYKELKAD